MDFPSRPVYQYSVPYLLQQCKPPDNNPNMYVTMNRTSYPATPRSHPGLCTRTRVCNFVACHVCHIRLWQCHCFVCCSGDVQLCCYGCPPETAHYTLSFCSVTPSVTFVSPFCFVSMSLADQFVATTIYSSHNHNLLLQFCLSFPDKFKGKQELVLLYEQ